MPMGFSYSSGMRYGDRVKIYADRLRKRYPNLSKDEIYRIARLKMK